MGKNSTETIPRLSDADLEAIAGKVADELERRGVYDELREIKAMVRACRCYDSARERY